MRSLWIGMVAVFVAAPAANAVPVQWTVAAGGNGHYYEYVPGVLRWDNAKIVAESSQHLGRLGHLATITSTEELAFFLTTFGASSNTPIGWLGGYQDHQAPGFAEPGGGWRWVTGEAWDYTNWWTDKGFPDEYQNGGQDYLRTQPSFFWDDVEIDPGVPGYYVEYSGPVLSADFDNDGDVDGVDLAVMFANFNGPGGGVPLTPETDLDGDGDADGVDIAAMFAQFTGPLSPANVPEPCGFVILGLGGLLAARRRNRPFGV